MFLPRPYRPFPCFTTSSTPALSFPPDSGLGLAWLLLRSECQGCRMERGLIYLKGQSSLSPALPTGPAAGCPEVHSKACSDSACWRKKDAGKGKKGSLRGPTALTGERSLVSAPPIQHRTPSAPSRPAEARMRRALRAPSLLRAALSPWQPRRDDGARASWARTGWGGAGPGRAAPVQAEAEVEVEAETAVEESGGHGDGVGVPDFCPPRRTILRRGFGPNGPSPWPWTPRK